MFIEHILNISPKCVHVELLFDYDTVILATKHLDNRKENTISDLHYLFYLFFIILGNFILPSLDVILYNMF